MATVIRENIGNLNDKLIVNLEKNDYLPSFEKSLKSYAKSANIPGFRKGMVPSGLIKKMYGQSVFTEEILRTVEKELNNYLGNEQLDIFAQPLPLESDSRMLDINNPGDYAFAFENLAFIFHKQKMYDEAFLYLDKALTITPDSNWALFRKGLIYEEKKQYEDAISFYEKILKLDNSDAFAQHNIANIYWNLGLYEQGRKKWTDTIKIYQQWATAKRPVENDENFYLYYGGIQNSIFGLSRDAETTYRKGLQYDPENYSHA